MSIVLTFVYMYMYVFQHIAYKLHIISFLRDSSSDSDLVHGACVIHAVGLLGERGKTREEKLNHVNQCALSKTTKQFCSKKKFNLFHCSQSSSLGRQIWNY